MKDGLGGLDGGPEMDRAWLALGNVDEQVCMRGGVDGVDRSQDGD